MRNTVTGCMQPSGGTRSPSSRTSPPRSDLVRGRSTSIQLPRRARPALSCSCDGRKPTSRRRHEKDRKATDPERVASHERVLRRGRAPAVLLASRARALRGRHFATRPSIASEQHIPRGGTDKPGFKPASPRAHLRGFARSRRGMAATPRTTREAGVRDAAQSTSRAFGELLRGRRSATAEPVPRVSSHRRSRRPRARWTGSGVGSSRKAGVKRIYSVSNPVRLSPNPPRVRWRSAGRALEADVAVSVTGVAGPAPLDGVEPGVVIVGVAIDGEATASRHRFTGDPTAICSRGVEAALDALADELDAPEP